MTDARKPLKGKKNKGDIRTKADLRKADVAFKKKVLGMDLDDFKMTFLQTRNELAWCIEETVKWSADQRDLLVKVFGKEIRQIKKRLEIADKNFQTLDSRLHDLESFTALLGIKFKEAQQRKSMTFEERRALAECVNIMWGKGEEATLNASMAKGGVDRGLHH